MPAAKKPPRVRPSPWAVVILVVCSAFTLCVLVLVSLGYNPL